MATKAAVPMACVHIGLETLLMPASKATQVITLLQSAVTCRESYTVNRTYTIGDQPDVEMRMVKPSQIRAAREPSDPLFLEND